MKSISLKSHKPATRFVVKSAMSALSTIFIILSLHAVYRIIGMIATSPFAIQASVIAIFVLCYRFYGSVYKKHSD